MKSYLAEFGLVAPARLAEALDLLAASNDRATMLPLAGATDLYVLWNAGELPPATFLSLHAIAEFQSGLAVEGKALHIGPLTTFSETRRDPNVGRRWPLLAAASRELGALQIQNRATWAGNVANASPAADGVPPLLAYDASVELVSRRGRRWVPLAEYFTGYKQSVRAVDELIAGIRVPSPAAGARHFFRKVGTRRAQAISKVVAAGVLERGRDGSVRRVRWALGSVAPTTIRAHRFEAALAGRPLDGTAVEAACAAVCEDAAPIDDVRSTQAYRARIVEKLSRAFLESAAE